jgi:hypothetical protein
MAKSWSQPRSLRRLMLGAATGLVAAGLVVVTLFVSGSGRRMPGGAVSGPGSSLASRAPSRTPQPTTAVPPGQSASMPAPGSSGQPGSAGTIRLTNQDDGGSITVHVGATLSVSLTPAPSYRWTEPLSSNEAVVRRASGATRPDGSVTATFVVLAGGGAQISSSDNPACYPQCLPPSRLWRVTISVVR